MSIQKIIARNSTEGLRRISEEIGEDALILKTVKRNGRVEFFVEAPEELILDELAAPERVSPELSLPEHFLSEHLLSEHLLSEHLLSEQANTESPGQDAGPGQQIKAEYREARLKMLSAIAEKAKQDGPTRAKVDSTAANPASPRPRRRIQSELSVKSFLEALELTPPMAARLRGYKRIDEVAANLSLMLNIAPAANDGIFALVGPAGSGKTTSLMKLVVQHVMAHGEDSCAIINLDHHSVGARERIDRFGELVGVDVIQVGPDIDLNEAIARVAKRRLVVIDTPGLSPKSPDLNQQLFTLGASHYEIQQMLVVPANLQFESMCHARKLYGNKKHTTCIATRMDEAMSCGPIISFLGQTSLPVRYLGTGTKIPEDLIPAGASELVEAAIGLMGPEFAKAGMTDLTKESSEMAKDKVMDL